MAALRFDRSLVRNSPLILSPNTENEMRMDLINDELVMGCGECSVCDGIMLEPREFFSEEMIFIEDDD